MKFNPQPLRKLERYRVRQIGLDDEQRRDVLESVTGHRSTTEISADQWSRYLDRLAELAGEKPSAFPPRPSSLDPRHSRPYPLGNAATARQLATIAWLRPQIAWTHADGPEEGFRHWVATFAFGPGSQPSVARDAWIDHNASLASLSASCASNIIKALYRLRSSQQAAAAALVGGASAPRDATADVPF